MVKRVRVHWDQSLEPFRNDICNQYEHFVRKDRPTTAGNEDNSNNKPPQTPDDKPGVQKQPNRQPRKAA